jgi:hypothetical protein
MPYRAPVGFPEAVLLGFMPYRKAMTVGEILRASPFRATNPRTGKSAYPALKRVLDQLVDAGWLDRTVREPRTGRPAFCYRRITALPK